VITRRTFAFGGAAAVFRAAFAPARRLETFTEWMNASPRERAAALQPCLDRIREMDASILAWVQVKPERPTGTGPLDEIPFGVKDVIETEGLATEYGSSIDKGRIGTADAAIVRDLRRRGAVVLGKTHTATFAMRTPPPTRNPRNLEHTPGGSSSGSAAAVAAGMVPAALGTQTGGSVLRPASFCGVTGFKPTYGLLPMDGVFPYAKSFDTLGLFTHTPGDMLLLWSAMGQAAGRPETIVFGVPDPMPDVDPPMASAFQRALAALRKAGATLRPVDISAMLASLNTASRTVMSYEGARVHAQRYKEFGDRLDAGAADVVRQGSQIPDRVYEDAKRRIADAQARVADLYRTTPVMLVPAAPGPAPLGLQSTGDPRMNAPWTALGTPAISIPMPVTDELPLGLQLTADRGRDARVIRAAIRVSDVLRS
jgi:Asp-tRNA(Asn)/Glu-tRNA(Gln) amidotransferase A subunit family amidase